MSPKLIITAVFVVLTVGSVGYVATRQDSAPDETATEASAAPSPSASPTVNPAASAAPVPASQGAPAAQKAAAGQYLDYNNIAQATGQRVLFFHAPWCSQCRSIEKGIKSEGVPDGLSIVKVDYDSNQALRQKYGIKLQTTFLKVDAQGNASGAPFVAYENPTFESVKRGYLN